MHESVSLKSSFALYPAEMKALGNRLAELSAAGVMLRRSRFLRALMHVTPESEMLEAAKRLAAAYAGKEGPRESDNIAGRLEVDLLESDLAKLDRVKVRLSQKKIFPGANRAFVVRAVVRWAPGGTALAPLVEKFLAEFPNKPRGLSKLRLAREAKRRD